MKKNFGKKTILATLPVLIVATYDENGIPDAMNVAWGGQCSAHHVALNLAIGHKTTENLLKKKVFTLSIANLDNLVLSDYFGLVSGHKANKIEAAGVHVSKSAFVDAPVIEEYPLTLECKVIGMEERLGEMYVVGEVINMQADESILNDAGRVDFDKLKPLSFDSSARTYRVLGETVGIAFKDGEKLLYKENQI